MPELEQIRAKLFSLGNKERAENSKRYLKSSYEFYGMKVLEMRKIMKEYKNLDFYSALNLFDELWNSGNHEEMNCALYLLENYAKQNQNELWKFLMERLNKATSWDLVDEMSGRILGVILADNINLMSEIKKMSESRNPWIRRTSIISTGRLIGKNKIELTLRLAEKLIYDEDVYVQKGAGWMLREAGKRNRFAVREFILMHIDMKPNAFSYATEKMTELRKIKKEKIKAEKEKLKNENKS
ncbi:DNA alkylation repair enzyme [uncultured archaeon]|nr:DNA alkylation repair enzyme [uncultured archaeon]